MHQMYINLSDVLIKKRNSKEIQYHLNTFCSLCTNEVTCKSEVSHDQDWTLLILLFFFHHQNQFFPIFRLLWHIVIVNYILPCIATVCETVPGSVSNSFLRSWELSVSTIPHAFPSFVPFYQPFLCGYLLTSSLLKNSEWIFLFPKSFSFLFSATMNKSHIYINLYLSSVC